MTHATLSAAIASAEARVSAIERRAAGCAGTPMELDAQIILEAARKSTANLRQLLATCPKGTP